MEAKIQITIDIFSGRQNPVIELRGDEARQILESLKPSRRLKKDEVGMPPRSTLGYRGLIIRLKGNKPRDLPKIFQLMNGNLFGPKLYHEATDVKFEDYFSSAKGPIRKLKVGENFSKFLRKEITRSRELQKKHAKPKWPHGNPCKCAPLYEPEWWNDAATIQYNNNCYNYGTNYRTDTYAQPGLAAGAMYSSLTCPSVKVAAVADSLIDSPAANNKCPKEGHLVALVVAPGWDFHWYRKGRNGYWTHKPGGTPATNLDNSGLTIPDPRTANRGPYTDFCTFMVVMHGHIKIR
jgi:hypothetical protein